MKKYIIIILAGLLTTSCVDNNLLPDDKTIEEDFWKTKSDVSLMVAGAYKSMVASDVIARCIVWGDFRSDDMNSTSAISISNATSTDLKEIAAAGIQPDNTFADWASLYKVINNCNVVLKHAESVMSIDPSYTDGDYKVDKSQMLALRSLAYFYLVRAFRDVPYSAEAFQNSSQDLQIPQVAPDSVLQLCINDLVEAEKNPIYPDGFKDWRKVGMINVNAIDAILADIYLWRASMTHNADYYSKCVEYCDKVITSKQQLYPKSLLDETASDYPLETGTNSFYNVFVTGNSKESIFELQMDGSSNANTAVNQYYNRLSSSYNYGYIQASKIFAIYDGNKSPLSSDYAYYSSQDYRFWENCYGVNKSGADAFDIRKMVSMTDVSTKLASVTSVKRAYDKYSQNWIVYRLSDVMLMKAEALVQLSSNDGDSCLSKAFGLVRAVSDRSMATLVDTIQFKDYKTKENMEKLVLSERQRELCFEGKRWFDLMRYNYRHITGVDATTTMAKQNDAGVSFARNYNDMLTMIARKYSEGGSTVTYKMGTEPTLYYPVLTSELKVNANLRQNPSYTNTGEYVKNY